MSNRVIQPIVRVIKKKFFKDALFLQSSSIVQQGIGVLTSIALVRLLGPEEYGTYASVMYFHGLAFTLGGFGIKGIVKQRLARHLHESEIDRDTVEELVSVFWKILLMGNAAILIVALLGAPWVAQGWFNDRDLGRYVQVLALKPLVSIPAGYFLVVASALREMVSVAFFQVVQSLLQAILVLILLLSGWGIWSIIIANILTSLIFSVIGLFLLHRVQGPHTYLTNFIGQPRSIATVSIRPYWRECVYNMISMKALRFPEPFLAFVLGRYVPQEQIGFFRLANRFIKIPTALLVSISKNMAMRIPQEFGRKGFEAARKLYNRAVLLMSPFTLGIAAVSAAIAPYLLRWFYGEEFLAATPLIYILLLHPATANIEMAPGSFFVLKGRLEMNLMKNLVMAICFAPAALFAIQQWNIVGAAFALTGVLLVRKLASCCLINWAMHS